MFVRINILELQKSSSHSPFALLTVCLEKHPTAPDVPGGALPTLALKSPRMNNSSLFFVSRITDSKIEWKESACSGLNSERCKVGA